MVYYNLRGKKNSWEREKKNDRKKLQRGMTYHIENDVMFCRPWKKPYFRNNILKAVIKKNTLKMNFDIPVDYIYWVEHHILSHFVGIIAFGILI